MTTPEMTRVIHEDLSALPSPGQRFCERYEILRRIGRGGMGEVYLARVEGPGGFEKLVALKVACSYAADRGDLLDRFLEEARLSARLNHANIAQIFDLGRTEDTYFIAMEYVPGIDLHALHHLAGAIPLPIACHVIARLCDGLDYAHRQRDGAGRPLKIVHRDISPSNVLVSVHGEVKLIDFGIARAANKVTHTQTGMIRGKVSYMSPEQVVGAPLDRRSDIFSCGVLLYELLTGKRPFDADTDVHTLEAIAECAPLPPRAHNPRLPAKLEEIVLKALRREPAERYSWANELGEALQGFLVSAGLNVGAKDLAAMVLDHAPEELRQEVIGPELEDGPGRATATKAAPIRLNDVVTAIMPPRVLQPRSARPGRSAIGLLAAAALCGFTGMSAGYPRALSAHEPLAPVAAAPRAVPPAPAPAPTPVIPVVVAAPPAPRVAPAAPPAPAEPLPPPAVAAHRPVRSRPASASAALGSLTVHANQPSVVLVDGKKAGSTPIDGLSIPAGRHLLRVDCVYGEKVVVGNDHAVTIPDGAEVNLDHECIEATGGDLVER